MWYGSRRREPVVTGVGREEETPALYRDPDGLRGKQPRDGAELQKVIEDVYKNTKPEQIERLRKLQNG